MPDGNIEDLLYEKFDVDNVNAVEMSDDFKEQNEDAKNNEECSENNNPKPARVFNFKIHEDDFKIMVVMSSISTVITSSSNVMTSFLNVMTSNGHKTGDDQLVISFTRPKYLAAGF